MVMEEGISLVGTQHLALSSSRQEVHGLLKPRYSGDTAMVGIKHQSIIQSINKIPFDRIIRH
jgi:hypothetical protein